MGHSVPDETHLPTGERGHPRCASPALNTAPDSADIISADCFSSQVWEGLQGKLTATRGKDLAVWGRKEGS